VQVRIHTESSPSSCSTTLSNISPICDLKHTNDFIIDKLHSQTFTYAAVKYEVLNSSAAFFKHMNYADDIVLLETSLSGMQLVTEMVKNEGKKVGLYMNVGKCNVLVSKDWREEK